MRTTIDKAGRVVIPAEIREKAGLEPGTELEVIVDDLSIRLVRSVPAPTVEKVGGRWVVRPSTPPEARPEVDVAALIDEERNRWPLR